MTMRLRIGRRASITYFNVEMKSSNGSKINYYVKMEMCGTKHIDTLQIMQQVDSQALTSYTKDSQVQISYGAKVQTLNASFG
ncbi:hypothetical protein M514_10309 [Trichuris suis]|uniref:Uncharacterized protein n=1 Tax=Trichuris suis TaxID=68888 RepID=A0A085NIS0_9BILA